MTSSLHGLVKMMLKGAVWFIFHIYLIIEYFTMNRFITVHGWLIHFTLKRHISNICCVMCKGENELLHTCYMNFIPIPFQMYFWQQVSLQHLIKTVYKACCSLKAIKRPCISSFTYRCISGTMCILVAPAVVKVTQKQQPRSHPQLFHSLLCVWSLKRFDIKGIYSNGNAILHS